MEVEQRAKKTEENKHGALIADFGNKNQSLSRPDVFIIQICKHHKM